MTKQRLEVLHEEEAFLVIDKPSGVLSVPDRYDQDLPNAKHLLQEIYGDIFTVHRIDKDTSGLLCFARTVEAHRHLSQQFAAHSPRKVYLALVEGIPLADEGVIETPLIEDPRKPGRMMTAAKGLSAYTTYKIAETFVNFSLLEVGIKTGRTHQIRVHLQSIGHPVVADPFYGRRQQLLLSSVKGKKYRLAKGKQERPLMDRTALQAYQLEFDHPTNGEPLSFTTELPKDFRATLNQLSRWDK
jgi:23S rRNA pseudouridine955/2504/2580 synthase/23S rRNA pseudouridine1911/1915/1917 synthase